jgi:hypothetical protein
MRGAVAWGKTVRAVTVSRCFLWGDQARRTRKFGLTSIGVSVAIAAQNNHHLRSLSTLQTAPSEMNFISPSLQTMGEVCVLQRASAIRERLSPH